METKIKTLEEKLNWARTCFFVAMKDNHPRQYEMLENYKKASDEYHKEKYKEEFK